MLLSLSSFILRELLWKSVNAEFSSLLLLKYSTPEACWTVPWVSTSTKTLAKSSVLQKRKGWPQSLQNCFSRNKGQHPTEVWGFFYSWGSTAYLVVHDDSWLEVADTCLLLPPQSKTLSTVPLKSSFPLWLDLQFHVLGHSTPLFLKLPDSLWLQWERKYCDWVYEKASYYGERMGCSKYRNFGGAAVW